MTNIQLKDGQEPSKTIQYNLGRFGRWTFDGFVEESMASLYSRGKFKKSHVMFSDGPNNHFMTMLAKKEGKIFPKEDHWVEIFGYLIMTIVWKPSGKVKFARYTARDKTLYKYLRKDYPNGTWISGKAPAWVNGK